MSTDPVTMEELLATETAQGAVRPLRMGETVEGTIAGRVVLSLGRVRNRKQWARTAEIQTAGCLIDTTVLEANRGCAVVDVGVRGLVPLSSACARTRGRRTSANLRPVRPSTRLSRGVMPFGAFARGADGVEGLIHVTELPGERVGDSNDAVHTGDVLPVRIVDIDRARRRLSLSARLAERTCDVVRKAVTADAERIIGTR